MKQILLLIISLAGLTACSKVAAPGSTAVIGKGADTVTITDNGITYTCIGNPVAQNNNVSCTITNLNFYPDIQLSAASSSGCPVFFSVSAYQAYNLQNGTDTSLYENIIAQQGGSNGNTFTELFNGGESYNVDTLIMDINTASGSTITGTYEMWLSNAAGYKVITGTIHSHNAVIRD